MLNYNSCVVCLCGVLNYNSCVVCLCARTHAALGVWRRERVLMFQKVSTSITLEDNGGPLLFVLTVKYQSKLHLKETKKLTATYQQCDHGLLETPATAISTNLIRSKIVVISFSLKRSMVSQIDCYLGILLCLLF